MPLTTGAVTQLTTIKIDQDVKAAIIREMGPQETYNQVLRRVLGLDTNGRKPATAAPGA